MTGRQTVVSWRGSSSTAASASGLPNSNHQRHHELRQEGKSALLGKIVFFYTTMHTNVNEKFCVFGGGHWWVAGMKSHEVVAYKSPWQDARGFSGRKECTDREELNGEPTIRHPMARHAYSSHG
jgi:hypothetical protein